MKKTNFLKSVKLSIAGLALASGLASCATASEKHKCASKAEEKSNCASKAKEEKANCSSAKSEKANCSSSKKSR